MYLMKEEVVTSRLQSLKKKSPPPHGNKLNIKQSRLIENTYPEEGYNAPLVPTPRVQLH